MDMRVFLLVIAHGLRLVREEDLGEDLRRVKSESMCHNELVNDVGSTLGKARAAKAMRCWALLLILGVILLSPGAWGQGQAPPGGMQKLVPAGECEGPAAALDVTSDRMTFNNQTHIFVFEDKVRVRRCGMTLASDRLQITTDAKGEANQIIATGNVHVQQGERQVVAERAEYFVAEQKLVFTGNPRAWDTQELRELTGEQIVILLQEEKMFVKAARVLFQPRKIPSKVP